MSGNRAGMHPEQYQRRRDRVEGWDINIVSYKLDGRYLCEIDNVDPGAQIGRGEGATREAAEAAALETARMRLARTRRRPAS